MNCTLHNKDDKSQQIITTSWCFSTAKEEWGMLLRAIPSSNVSETSSLLTSFFCFPAECVLHQLPAAAPGSAESDNRWRRQQMSGGREQQTQTAGVQLRSYQAHEAHMDVHSGKKKTQTNEDNYIITTRSSMNKTTNSSCAQVLAISHPPFRCRLWSQWFANWYSVCSCNVLLSRFECAFSFFFF